VKAPEVKERVAVKVKKPLPVAKVETKEKEPLKPKKEAKEKEPVKAKKETKEKEPVKAKKGKKKE
jgi:hypothetical protein